MVAALGLDLGARRIGVAGCDRTGLVATGLTTLHRTDFESILNPLLKLVQERKIEVLVIGLPYTLAGEIGNQAKKTQKQARKLSKALNLPVEFVDERLTSFAAEELMAAQGQSASVDKGLVDRKAAAIILQQWLDTRRNST